MQVELINLLKPISEEQPNGEDLRLQSDFNNPYYQLKNLRLQARQNERQRIQSSETTIFNAHEWRDIEQLAIELLQNKSKDLEISSWLVEAWLRMDGIAGLQQGLELLQGLVENFQQQLYPQPTEDDPDCQLAAVQGLVGSLQPGTLIMPLQSQLLTQAAGSENYAAWQCQQALEQAQKPDNNANQATTVNIKMVNQAALTTPAEKSENWLVTVAACLEALQLCEDSFKQYFEQAAPNWAFLREALLQIQSILQKLYPEEISAPALEPDTDAQTSNEDDKRPLTSRDAVIASIVDAANYFLEQEPHSPIAYLLHQAARWAQTSLSELMYEILSGSDAYLAYCKMVGLPQVDEQVDEMPAQNSVATDVFDR